MALKLNSCQLRLSINELKRVVRTLFVCFFVGWLVGRSLVGRSVGGLLGGHWLVGWFGLGLVWFGFGWVV